MTANNQKPISLSLPYDLFGCYLKSVFSKEECKELITLSEKIGYGPAMITGSDGEEVINTEIRNCSRCMVDNQELADDIYSRIKHVFPEEFEGQKLFGVNLRLRFLKYHPGEYFKLHYDYPYTTPDGKMSTEMTVLLYLNEDYEGGSTMFYSDSEKKALEFEANQGHVLIFEHGVLHEGRTVTKGVKYIVRLDILYINQEQ